MKVTTGIDIVRSQRIKDVVDKSGDSFLERVFHADERSVCDAAANPFERYAARFAAKEAFVKALDEQTPNIPYNNICVKKDGNIPRIKLCGDQGAAYEKRIASISVSIAHEKEYAVASVVILWDE